MYETITTVRGTIITDPVTRRVNDGAVHSFRVASNTRHLDRETGHWRTSSTLYLRVSCWGVLAGQANIFVKGDAVLVQGRLMTNEYEKDGVLRSDLEMRATAIGPDLSRMSVVKMLRRPPMAEEDRLRSGDTETTEEVRDGGVGTGDEGDVDFGDGGGYQPENGDPGRAAVLTGTPETGLLAP